MYRCRQANFLASLLTCSNMIIIGKILNEKTGNISFSKNSLLAHSKLLKPLFYSMWHGSTL